MAQEMPERSGEPYLVDTVEEPCYGCGVVQEMEIKAQEYVQNVTQHYAAGECPVCGNDHTENEPW